MGFLKRLFSSPDVIEKTVDGIYSGVDKVFFTQEERSEATQKAQEIYQAMWMAAVPSALSRRIIACSVTFVWVILVLLMVALGIFDNMASAEFTFEVMKSIVATPFGIIIGFYFLSQVVTNFKK